MSQTLFVLSLGFLLTALAAVGREYFLPRIKNLRARRAVADVGLYVDSVIRRAAQRTLPVGFTLQTATVAMLEQVLAVAVVDYGAARDRGPRGGPFPTARSMPSWRARLKRVWRAWPPCPQGPPPRPRAHPQHPLGRSGRGG